jgi:hypothetical protein
MSPAPPSIETMFFDFVFPCPPFFPPFFCVCVGGDKNTNPKPYMDKKKAKKKGGGGKSTAEKRPLPMMMTTKGTKKEHNRHFTYLITLTPK